jgi:4'-phosphopantetheinyl transferase
MMRATGHRLAEDERADRWIDPEAETSIDVYVVDLDVDDSECGRFDDLIDRPERERVARFRFERDRQRYIRRRGMLRLLLARYLDCAPAKIEFLCNAFGKPFVVDQGNIRFNLAHSRGLALYAIARGREVGCDIEWRIPQLASPTVAAQFFSHVERRVLWSLPRNCWEEGFFNCWTRKEAFLKARGDGLLGSLDGFDVSLAPGEPASLLRGCDGWSVRSFEPLPRCHAAIVAEGTSFRLDVQSVGELRRAAKRAVRIRSAVEGCHAASCNG